MTLALTIATIAASYMLLGWVVWRLSDTISKLLAAVVAHDPTAARSYRDIQQSENAAQQQYRQTVEALAEMMRPEPEPAPVGFDGGLV